MSALDVTAFLARIGYGGPVEPNATVLADIHWAHLQAVPFENLEIRPLHRAIALDPASLFDKIVTRRRGGFCYELNGLLADVLHAIGFDAARVSVQFIGEEDGSPPFDHMGLLVRPPGQRTRFLVDVGCGRNSPARPLPLIEGYEEFQAETRTTYRLELIDDRWVVHQRPEGEATKPVYQFAVTPYEQSDFVARCHELSTLPTSPFTQGPLCSRNLPGGRVTLASGRLIVTQGGERREEDVPDNAFNAVLREHFDIDLSREWAIVGQT